MNAFGKPMDFEKNEEGCEKKQRETKMGEWIQYNTSRNCDVNTSDEHS